MPMAQVWRNPLPAGAIPPLPGLPVGTIVSGYDVIRGLYMCGTVVESEDPDKNMQELLKFNPLINVVEVRVAIPMLGWCAPKEPETIGTSGPRYKSADHMRLNPQR